MQVSSRNKKLLSWVDQCWLLHNLICLHKSNKRCHKKNNRSTKYIQRNIFKHNTWKYPLSKTKTHFQLFIYKPYIAYIFNMFYFTGPLSSCGSPLNLSFEVSSVSNAWMLLELVTGQNNHRHWLQSLQAVIQLQSRKQLLLPKNELSFNLDQFPIIKRLKILKGQTSSANYGSNTVKLLDDIEYISNADGYHKIVTASTIKKYFYLTLGSSGPLVNIYNYTLLNAESHEFIYRSKTKIWKSGAKFSDDESSSVTVIQSR